MYVRNACLIAGIAAGALALASATYASDNTADTFVTKASIANMFEIETSKLALERSHHEGVKTFAKQMVDDHTKAGEKLTAALQKSNSKLKQAEGLDDAHKEKLAELKNTADDNFDQAYIELQADAHKQAVMLFSDYADNGKDAALKQLAADTLSCFPFPMEIRWLEQ